MTLYDIINYKSASSEYRAKLTFANDLIRCVQLARGNDFGGFPKDFFNRAIESFSGARSMYNAISENHFTYDEYRKIENLLWKVWHKYNHE